jgi:MFS family permease
LVSAVGAAVALCILGDSLLYSILPLEATRIGIPLAFVGLLLSVNRLVRLATNGVASALFERWGAPHIFLAACVMGFISTVLYGLSTGILLFLLARILWGAAWSGLRQGGYQAVWSGVATQKGRLTGLLWGIIRLGSALSVLIGGFLYDRVGFHTTIWAITVVTALAIPVAYWLPWPAAHLPSPDTNRLPRRTLNAKTQRRKDAKDFLASLPLGVFAFRFVTRWHQWRSNFLVTLREPRSRWLTISGGLQLLSSSVVIATSSLLLAQMAGSEAAISWLGVATVTGLLQGARWLSDISVGPALGALSDRVGQANLALTLITLSLTCIVGLWLLPAGAAIYCLLLILLCDSGLTVTLSAAASGLAAHSGRPHQFIGVYTTASDFGSALGPLFALSVGQAIGFTTLYLVIGFSCLLAILRYRRLARRP